MKERVWCGACFILGEGIVLIATHCFSDDDNRIELKPLRASDEYQEGYINASYIDVRT